MKLVDREKKLAKFNKVAEEYLPTILDQVLSQEMGKLASEVLREEQEILDKAVEDMKARRRRRQG